MNDCKCPYQILVADGGVDTEVEKYLRDGNNFPSLNLQYLRYQPDNNFSCYYAKLQDIVLRTKTKYLMFADNDDFILFQHIKDLISALETNEKLVSCGGEVVDLNIYNNNCLTSSVGGDSYSARYFSGDKSIINPASVDRINYFFNNVDIKGLWNSWYQIHRTKAISDSLSILETYQFQEIVIFEIWFHISLLQMGGYGHLPVPILLRQNGTSEATASINRDNNLIERWLLNNSFAELDYCLSLFEKNNNIIIKKMVYPSIAVWIASRCNSIYQKNSFINVIKNYLNKFIYNGNLISKLYYRRRIVFYNAKDIQKYILGKF
jgi:glycosyltransferase domain-containing protein